MLKIFVALFYHELLLRLRNSHEWLYPLSFFVMLIVLLPLALQTFHVGLIWIAALFASLLSINQVFAADYEDGYLEQAFLSGHPLTIFILATLAAQWILSALPLIVLAPLAELCFSTNSEVTHHELPLILGLLLGTPIFTMIGSLGVALTHGLRFQGMLLGLMMLPLTMPILIFGITLIQQADAHLPILGGVCMLAGVNVLALTCLPWLIAFVLRLGLDE